MADARRIVREVAGAVGLAEGEAGVEAVLAVLARLEPVSIRRVSRATELPVPLVASICGELRKRAVVSEERPARLTDAGRALYAGGGLRIAQATCGTCRGRGVIVADSLGPAVRDVARLAKRVPSPRLELDQCHCTVETKLRRVLSMHEAGALVRRRVLVLGDDDLTSLTIARVVRRHGSKTSIRGLSVVDLDADLLAFLRAELAGAPFPTSVVRHDLRLPLPRTLAGRFDTVVTDPPYTLAGARLFLSRAAQALAVPHGDVFLSFGSRRPNASALLQRAIVDMGFVVRSLTRDFNEYVGAGVLGGTSHLYHLSATAETRPLVEERFAGPLYTADAS